MLLTCVPFFAGAYFGYRMPTEQLEDLIQGSVGGSSNASESIANNKKNGSKTTDSSRATTKTNKSPVKRTPVVDQDAIRTMAARTAFKALRIATLGTVGIFGFVGALGFYISSYASFEDAVVGTKRRASSWGKSLEHAMGGDRALSKTHPEVLATKHMGAEDELRYIYDKYIKEGGEDDKGASLLDVSVDDTQTQVETSPTLYTIYEKYFKK